VIRSIETAIDFIIFEVNYSTPIRRRGGVGVCCIRRFLGSQVEVAINQSCSHIACWQSRLGSRAAHRRYAFSSFRLKGPGCGICRESMKIVDVPKRMHEAMKAPQYARRRQSSIANTDIPAQPTRSYVITLTL
jgi:hypothetical protein